MFEYNVKELYKDKEACEKLKEVGLLEIVAKVISSAGLISVDFKDIKCLLKNRTIINSFYKKININDKINLNFTNCEHSNAIVVIEGNPDISIKDVENVLNSIRIAIGGYVDIIYGMIMNDELDINDINLLIINAK